jgi:hypothetical protein
MSEPKRPSPHQRTNQAVGCPLEGAGANCMLRAGARGHRLLYRGGLGTNAARTPAAGGGRGLDEGQYDPESGPPT